VAVAPRYEVVTSELKRVFSAGHRSSARVSCPGEDAGEPSAFGEAEGCIDGCLGDVWTSEQEIPRKAKFILGRDSGSKQQVRRG
jgi:hypothetical protein